MKHLLIIFSLLLTSFICCNEPKLNKSSLHNKLEKYKWQKPHKPNLTGTDSAYYPNKDKDVNEKKYKSWKN